CPDQRPRPRFLGIPAGLFRHARLVALAGGPRGRPAFRGIGVYARRGAGVGGTRRAWRRDGVAALAGPLPPALEAAAMIAQTFALADAPRRAGAALSRTALDTALVEAAIAAGAEFLPLVRASLVGTSAGERIARLRGGGGQVDVAARLILVATGLGASLAPAAPTPRRRRDRHSRVGAGLLLDRGPPWLRRGTVYMACGAAGYVGMVRLEDDRVEAAAALD